MEGAVNDDTLSHEILNTMAVSRESVTVRVVLADLRQLHPSTLIVKKRVNRLLYALRTEGLLVSYKKESDTATYWKLPSSRRDSLPSHESTKVMVYLDLASIHRCYDTVKRAKERHGEQFDFRVYGTPIVCLQNDAEHRDVRLVCDNTVKGISASTILFDIGADLQRHNDMLSILVFSTSKLLDIFLTYELANRCPFAVVNDDTRAKAYIDNMMKNLDRPHKIKD